jgi:hypothetical protein
MQCAQLKTSYDTPHFYYVVKFEDCMLQFVKIFITNIYENKEQE